MLTIHQVNTLYRDGVDIRFKKKKGSNRLKGEYDPNSLEGIIYMKEVESLEDRDITMLHEFIHARNGARGYRYKDVEDVVETEAKKTYERRPEVLKYIKELYGIKD